MSLITRARDVGNFFKDRSFIQDGLGYVAEKQPDGRVQVRIPKKPKKHKVSAPPPAFAGYFQAAEDLNALYLFSDGYTDPVLFATISGPIGVASSSTLLLVTQYSSQNVLLVAPDGSSTVFATLPAGALESAERYPAIVPPEAATAGFTPGDVFVTQGKDIYKISAGVVSLFLTLPDASDDHTGITFDRVGTFDFKMILTTEPGKVYKVSSGGGATLVADTGMGIEGPGVVPSDFGPHGGEIWVADETNGAVHTVKNDGTVTTYVIDLLGAEACIIVPASATAFGGPGVLIPSEFGGALALITFDGSYETNFAGTIPDALFEGGDFVGF